MREDGKPLHRCPCCGHRSRWPVSRCRACGWQATGAQRQRGFAELLLLAALVVVVGALLLALDLLLTGFPTCEERGGRETVTYRQHIGGNVTERHDCEGARW